MDRRLLLALPLLACRTPHAPAPQFTEVDVVRLMEDRYTAAMNAHDSVILGDLDASRAALEALATADPPDGEPEAWKPHLERLTTSARDLSTAPDIAAAAAGIGQLTLVCAGCHAELEAGTIYAAPAPPDVTGAVTTVMEHHQWASERLWEGVTGPWDAAWKVGATALLREPLFPEGTTHDALPPEALAAEARVHALATRALEEEDPKDRATTYGELLATCASCHRAIGVTPTVTPPSFPLSDRLKGR